jgi:hypothetical protein
MLLSTWAEDHGEHVGYCSVHRQRILDSCELCDDIDWTCIECEEVKYGDARVEVGLKCGECAYG